MLACVACVGKDAIKYLYHFRNRTRAQRFNRVTRARGKGGCCVEARPEAFLCFIFRFPFRNTMGRDGEGGPGNKLIQRCLMIIVNRFASGQRVTFRTFDQRLIQVTLSFNIVSSCSVTQAIPITLCHSNVDRNC